MTKKYLECLCACHVLVLDEAQWDCAGEDSAFATLDVTMWTTVPVRLQRPWWKDLFYLPRYIEKARELYQTWKGERYAEWVVLGRDEVVELRDHLTTLLEKSPEEGR